MFMFKPRYYIYERKQEVLVRLIRFESSTFLKVSQFYPTLQLIIALSLTIHLLTHLGYCEYDSRNHSVQIHVRFMLCED